MTLLSREILLYIWQHPVICRANIEQAMSWTANGLYRRFATLLRKPSQYLFYRNKLIIKTTLHGYRNTWMTYTECCFGNIFTNEEALTESPQIIYLYFINFVKTNSFIKECSLFTALVSFGKGSTFCYKPTIFQGHCGPNIWLKV